MILLFVEMFLSVCLFDVWDRLWVLIRSVPEVSLLIVFIIRSVSVSFLSDESLLVSNASAAALIRESIIFVMCLRCFCCWLMPLNFQIPED